MANQYTIKNFTEDEIRSIIEFYQSGSSLSSLAKTYKCGKRRIKRLLTESNVWCDYRDKNGILFTDDKINDIKELYENGMGLQKIADKYEVSKTPIKRIVNDLGILRNGNSNGKKIELTDEQKSEIKHLYLDNYFNSNKIAENMKLTPSFVNKYLSKVDYRRSKSEATTLSKTGVKLSNKTKHNMTIAQRKLARSGIRKQTGGVCKRYEVEGLTCVGTYEKFYINKLVRDNIKLPVDGEPINTPYGTYYPDFTYQDRHIEVKSDYTYDVMVGLKENRWTGKIDTTQYNKIKWVNKNVLPVEIVVVDKRNNNLIKRKLS